MTLVSDKSALMELNNILSSRTVGEIDLKGVPKLMPSYTVTDAAVAMRDMKHGSTLVCDEGRLVGIFTERDWLRMVEGCADLSAKLSEVMTEPQTVTTDDSLLDAIRLMDEGGYRRVPVVNGKGAPVGIIDVKTVIHFLVQYFPAAVYNQASSKQLIATSPEGA